MFDKRSGEEVGLTQETIALAVTKKKTYPHKVSVWIAGNLMNAQGQGQPEVLTDISRKINKFYPRYGEITYQEFQKDFFNKIGFDLTQKRVIPNQRLLHNVPRI